MVGDWPLFALLLVCGAALSAVGAGVAWLRRGEPGAVPLVVFQLALTVGATTYALDVVARDRGLQLLWASIWLVAQSVTATTWLYVALEYAGHARWASRKTAALLGVEPALLAIALAVPSARELLFTLPDSGTPGSIVYEGIEEGTLLFGHYGYLVVVMLAGTVVFVQLFARSRHLYRTQALAVVVAAVAPWSTVLIQSLGFVPESDPSIFAWMVAGLALTAGLYEFKTLDPVPAAHETIVETMGNGMVVLDADDLIGDANPAARTLLGSADPVGETIDEVFPAWKRLPKPAESAGDWENIAVTVDSEERFVEARVSPFHDHHGALAGRLLELRDVTERERRERDLARFKTIFESVADRVYVLDGDDRFALVNDAFASLLGEDRDALVGRHFESVVTAGTPTEGTSEVTVVTADGEELPCEIQQSPIDFEFAGLEGGVVGVVRDISRRKRIESDLAATTERYETVIEASPLAIVAVDRDGVVERWNPAAAETFGWEQSAVVGEQLPIVPPEERERVGELREAALDGERFTDLELDLQRRDGSRFDASVSVAPITDQDGDIEGAVVTVTDVTDRVERERQLERQNERLEEFASVVSHDLRNPLQVAQGHLELATNDDSERLDAASDALERMERLIDDVLRLARDGRAISEPEPVTLEPIVRAAWATIDTENATLDLDPLPDVEGDPGRLPELFENLFRNSVEHSSTSSRAEPDDSVEHGPASVTVSVGSLPDATGFYVADDGPGIPPEEREAVFETGYTTADDGTGFGLSIVETIAQAHDWDVIVTESDAGGARFEFLLAQYPTATTEEEAGTTTAAGEDD